MCQETLLRFVTTQILTLRFSCSLARQAPGCNACCAVPPCRRAACLRVPSHRTTRWADMGCMLAKAQTTSTEGDQQPPACAPPRSAAFHNVRLPCRVTSVVDGDTVRVVTRASPEEPWALYVVRLTGVDTPEKRGGTALEQTAALAATEYVSALVRGKGGGAVGTLVCGSQADKFGRLLGDVVLPDVPEGVAQRVLRAGVGRPYHGRAKVPWTPEELRAVHAAATTKGLTFRPLNPVRESVGIY